MNETLIFFKITFLEIKHTYSSNFLIGESTFEIHLLVYFAAA